jgi:manganese/zinc/iron transport system permease protein
MSVLVLVMVAVACVAAFWAVGSVLVIAALVAPAAIARLVTNSYAVQFGVSAAVAVAMGAGGYGTAAMLPGVLGLGHGLNAAGMIAVVAGVMLTLAWIFGSFGRRGGRRRRAALTAAPTPTHAT